MHHGVVGMKWGVRRYQNKDGSLTPKGKARFNKVSASKLQSTIDTSNAKQVFKRNAKTFATIGNAHGRIADKELRKANKYAKDTDAYKKHIAKSEHNRKMSDEYLKESELSSKKLSDIDSGKIKAGRDFIVQRDMNFHISTMGLYRDATNTQLERNSHKYTMVNPIFGTSHDYTVIEKNRN